MLSVPEAVAVRPEGGCGAEGVGRGVAVAGTGVAVAVSGAGVGVAGNGVGAAVALGAGVDVGPPSGGDIVGREPRRGTVMVFASPQFKKLVWPVISP